MSGERDPAEPERSGERVSEYELWAMEQEYGRSRSAHICSGSNANCVVQLGTNW